MAPVVAVRGNHDEREGHRDLPRDVLVRAGGRADRPHPRHPPGSGAPGRRVSLVAGRPVHLGFERAMLGASAPRLRGRRPPPRADPPRVGGVLLFSPGAVYSPSTTPASPGGLARGYRRYRGRLPPDARAPGVGLIEAGPGGVSAGSSPSGGHPGG